MSYDDKVRAAYEAFVALTDDERGLVACWFCNTCWRYVGPGDSCHHVNDDGPIACPKCDGERYMKDGSLCTLCNCAFIYPTESGSAGERCWNTKDAHEEKQQNDWCDGEPQHEFQIGTA